MIACEELTKVYGKIRALDGLSLRVERGEIFGFLGPNGAGKTTAIRILTTLTKPTSGRAWVDGFDVTAQPSEVKKRIGVVQQHLSLDRELAVWEVLELHARLHGLKPPERRRRIEEMLDYVELKDHAHRKVEELSGGMKRRLMIARALLHRPKLILLDEPTVGLDARTRRKLWELIRRLNADGVTVFLTTHYIEEAESLCHRVGIIHRGRLVALAEPSELCRRLGSVTVEIFSDGRVSCRHFRDAEEARAFIQSLPPEVKSITMRKTNLEDVFIELTGRRIEDDQDPEG